jgi:hypothetical protein|tara:strand:+ start:1238 stop:2278 length:1041 start_codon:yes stop_codon:yes gene_type:complete
MTQLSSSIYEIRMCKHKELDLLKSFLESSWSKEHIFLRDQSILDFQHKSSEGYNFVVAYHKEQNCFHGVLGIISPGFYLNNSISYAEDIWLAIWKVEKKLAEINSLGMDLLNYVNTRFKPKTISAIGINKTVSILYKFLGYKVKKMRHWFIPNRHYKEYKIIFGDITEKKIQSSLLTSIIYFTNDNRELINDFFYNDKVKDSFDYLVNRYIDHPSYEYQIIGICNEANKLIAVCIGREVYGNKSKAFRLMELFFEPPDVQDISRTLDTFMHRNSYEYVDFLEYGFDCKVLEAFGFERCSEKLYVPHLFEPFVQDRKEVIIAFKSQDPFYCTKGDSDLDRPNRINQV